MGFHEALLHSPTTEWAAALGAHELPAEIGTRGIVIVAHPDDEVIGAGARLSRWSDADVVYVTDGAPHDMRDASALGIVRREDYAALRRAERRQALDLARVEARRAHDLGYTDNDASNNLIELTADLLNIFVATAPDVVMTHPYEGGHPDHDATSFAVSSAVQLLTRNGGRVPLVVEMASYHLCRDGIATGCFLPLSDDGAEFHTVLDEASRILKRRMLECHASQRDVLARFRCDIEPIRIAPRYDFEVPPHAGRLLYEHFSWCLSGSEWRARVREAARALGVGTHRRLAS